MAIGSFVFLQRVAFQACSPSRHLVQAQVAQWLVVAVSAGPVGVGADVSSQVVVASAYVVEVWVLVRGAPGGAG